ncbi:hypothetical protein WN71_025140 [Streptomyces mangrovisoli]|uniref:Cell wall protein n=1 Tax=Streptomyces mangrovisoli TaxID=1428628 RepID=A0A1J4NV51_9ACTN|nr:hypothetical protein WN71_025140 [Streptomyces mangrovisoli]
MLTATAAATVLGALWFVPSAHASQDDSARTASPAVTQQARVTTGADSAAAAQSGSQLADTGSVDTTPYVVGGTLFLTLGAGFVVYSVRRERLGF